MKYKYDGFTNDIDGGIPFWPTYFNKDKAYQIIDAIDFIDMAEKSNSEKMKDLAKELNTKRISLGLIAFLIASISFIICSSTAKDRKSVV